MSSERYRPARGMPTHNGSAYRTAGLTCGCLAVLASCAILTGCGSNLVDTLVGGLLTGTGGGLTVVPPDFPVRVGEGWQFQIAASSQASSVEKLSWQSSCASGAGTITTGGAFTALGMGQCTVWATYQIPPTDPNQPATQGSTNRVTFDIWPYGPKAGT